MNTTYLFFTLRNAKARTGQAVSLLPNHIKSVSVEPRQILVTRLDGSTLVNANPTPKEKSFWLKYQVPGQNPTRWDMASPDGLAMAELEEYDKPKLQ